MLDTLNKEDRMRLMKLVCSMAWADDEIQDAESLFVVRLINRFELDPDETDQVEAWLAEPPPAADIDPAAVPREHRQLFIEQARALLTADGELKPEELQQLNAFKLLVQWADYGDAPGT